MLSELPDLDENVSFVVDDGASVGPIAMRQIISSVQNGERDPSSLIWWSGAPDWIRFDASNDLMSFISPSNIDHREAARAAIFAPPAQEVSAVEVIEPVAAETAPAPTDEPVMAATRFPQTEEAVAQEAPHVFEPASLSPAHSTPGPALVQPAEAVVASAESAPEVEAPTADGDAFSFSLPTRVSGESPDDGEAARPGLTGLFSSGARVDSESAASGAPPSADALDAILVARASLESVGARIEALSSATKQSLTPEEIRSGVDEFAEPVAPSPGAATNSPTAPVSTSGSWTAVEAQPDPVEPAEDSPSLTEARAELTDRFEEMVAKSVEHQRRIEWVMRVDELLLSACITAIADSGFVAMDLNSRESDHRVLFEHNDDSRRVRLSLAPLENVSQHLGRHVTFGLSWGRDVARADQAFEIVRKHTTDGPVAPGMMTCEADVATSSVLTHVNLILAADDFVKNDYSVDRPSLDSSIAATLHALEMHWLMLFENV